MEKISYATKKIITIISNFIFIVTTFLAALILEEYIYGINSDYAKFKMTHSPIKITGDALIILTWIIFSVFIYKYNKKLISKDRSIMAYSIIPFAVFLIIYLSSRFL